MLSPSTSARDRGVKQALYARHGVPYYWVVDPVARVLQELRLDGGSYAAGAVLEDTAPVALPPLPGLTLDPSAV